MYLSAQRCHAEGDSLALAIGRRVLLYASGRPDVNAGQDAVDSDPAWCGKQVSGILKVEGTWSCVAILQGFRDSWDLREPGPEKTLGDTQTVNTYLMRCHVEQGAGLLCSAQANRTRTDRWE